MHENGYGVPKSTLLRMAFYIGHDYEVRMIPFLGDAFDFVWKSNKQNMELIRTRATGEQGTGSDYAFVFIIMGLLVATQASFAGEVGFLRHFYQPNADHVPFWLVVGAHTFIGLGTLFGGWRIVKTMGQRITKLQPVHGFCAETGGAITLFAATAMGIPVSTTHTIAGSIIGVGATKRLSAVRWGVTINLLWAWILTIPVSALLAAIVFYIVNLFF